MTIIDKKLTWTSQQIAQHKTAASLLCQIMRASFDLIRQNPAVTEYKVQQFIVESYAKNGLVSDNDPPIVAFRENTSFVHYFPDQKTSKRLTKNSLIMIDIWARLNENSAPYADITWMAWYGGAVPAEIKAGFDIILQSRDQGLEIIRDGLDKGVVIKNSELGRAMEDITLSSDLQEMIPHSYGHSLGLKSCHGDTSKFGLLMSGSKMSLVNNMGYTIEPGIYVDGKYGFRSEIDFYIADGKLVVTTDIQEELEIL
ncbi:aminopeptidase P family protein [Candidatus Saccharibacteria bacterium]|nr:aminopeptidase P family protein [Candidatus Saccharibacteria bacterium]